MPRARDTSHYRSRRRPHLSPPGECHTIICYCPECDKDIERNLPLRLSEYCDCDQYTRWICISCKILEEKEDEYYLKTSTKDWWDPMNPENCEDGMVVADHQSDRSVS
jgi:hypothetical protein